MYHIPTFPKVHAKKKKTLRRDIPYTAKMNPPKCCIESPTGPTGPRGETGSRGKRRKRGATGETALLDQQEQLK